MEPNSTSTYHTNYKATVNLKGSNREEYLLPNNAKNRYKTHMNQTEVTLPYAKWGEREKCNMRKYLKYL